MTVWRRAPIRRDRHGRYLVNLSEDERQLLKALPPQLIELLRDPEQPGLQRLFPPAYHQDVDEEAAAEYRRLMQDDLVARHREALDVLAATADATELSEAEITGWMRSLNDLRLVLGTSLDVTEDNDRFEDPEHQVYYYLGYLQECVVAALSEED